MARASATIRTSLGARLAEGPRSVAGGGGGGDHVVDERHPGGHPRALRHLECALQVLRARSATRRTDLVLRGPGTHEQLRLQRQLRARGRAPGRARAPDRSRARGAATRAAGWARWRRARRAPLKPRPGQLHQRPAKNGRSWYLNRGTASAHRALEAERHVDPRERRRTRPGSARTSRPAPPPARRSADTQARARRAASPDTPRRAARPPRERATGRTARREEDVEDAHSPPPCGAVEHHHTTCQERSSATAKTTVPTTRA